MNKKHQVLKIIEDLMATHQDGISNANIIHSLIYEHPDFINDEDMKYFNKGVDEETCVKSAYGQVIKKAWKDIEIELHNEGFMLERSGRKNTVYRFPKRLPFSPCERILNRERRNVKQEIYEILKNSADLLPESWIAKLGLLPEEDEAHWNKIVQFDTASLRNHELIPVMYDMIKAKRVIQFKYQPFGKNPYRVTFIPYMLKEYNLRWFVCGNSWNNKTNKYQHTVFALDRIVSPIETLDAKYQENSLDYDRHFNDVVGVSVDMRKDVEDVMIKVVDNLALDYIKTKKLHPSQQVIGDVIMLRVRDNYELESKLLEFADRIIILQPEHLRDKLKKRAETIVEMMTKNDL